MDFLRVRSAVKAEADAAAEEQVPNLEDETSAAKESRRRRRLRRNAEEVAMSIAFLAAVFTADHFANAGPAAFGIASVCVAAAIAILVFWFMLYFRRHRALDEFERVVELRALAIAGAGAVLFATSWGVAEIILAAPDFPPAMLAPMFSIFYVLARLRIASDFR